MCCLGLSLTMRRIEILDWQLVIKNCGIEVGGVASQSAAERGPPSATAVSSLFNPYFLPLNFKATSESGQSLG